MAVVHMDQTACGTNTNVVATSVRLSAIHIDLPTDGLSALANVMIYDTASAPTAGTDVPVAALALPLPATSGLRGRVKMIFPAGGKRMANGIGISVTTVFNGATLVSTTARPAGIDVYFEPGN
jgi:hypothetical protein